MEVFIKKSGNLNKTCSFGELIQPNSGLIFSRDFLVPGTIAQDNIMLDRIGHRFHSCMIQNKPDTTHLMVHMYSLWCGLYCVNDIDD
jgi:hypothetical protein